MLNGHLKVKIKKPFKGEFVPTFKEDMFETDQLPLRKETEPEPEINGNQEFNPGFQPAGIPLKTEPIPNPSTPKPRRPRLFDYNPVEVPNLDQQLSLRKQMESQENQERLQIEADRIRTEEEKNKRIEARLQEIKTEQNVRAEFQTSIF